MTFQAGYLFGNYRIVRLIGEGGFGEVYLAENPLIDRRVAVKVLHGAMAQDAEVVRRFLNEARAASAIRHPNIVDVLDAGGTPEGAPYILMEFLDGVSLQKRLADAGRLALPQVLDIASQAGSALAAAHGVGIVHRDLKPENLFLVPDAEVPTGERVKVLDFGIAKIKHASSTGGTVKTQSGIIMGSPAYMSPEQCRDSSDVDLRSDIYSFATILYEMLAGRTPYVHSSGTQLLIMHLVERPPPLRKLAANVPAYAEAAIMRALAREREDRPSSIPAFLSELRGKASRSTAILSQPSSSPIPPARKVKAARRTERLDAVQPNTTFSRSAGDVVSSESNEQLPMPRSRRMVFVGAGVVSLCAVAAVVVSLKYRQRPAGEGQEATGRPVQISRPVMAPPEPIPAPLPPANQRVIPREQDIPTADVAEKHAEAIAAEGTQPAPKQPPIGDERRKRKIKAAENAHSSGGSPQAISPEPRHHPSVRPTGASPAANPGPAAKIIKPIEF